MVKAAQNAAVLERFKQNRSRTNAENINVFCLSLAMKPLKMLSSLSIEVGRGY
ncbi:MAG: hypothetical protein WBS33_05000 [Verrucomicrobiia bacterium]